MTKLTRWIGRLLPVLLTGCAALRDPVVPALRDVPDKIPVVFIPGVTGTQLRDRGTDHILWGNAAGLFFPPDGGYSLARPLHWGATEKDNVDPFAPILDVKLFGVIKAFDAYGPLQRVMQRNGYQLGNLLQPKPGDNFFFFLYDWRQDNVYSATQLARQLEQ